MTPYSGASTKMLKAHLDNVKNLRRLVSSMEKPKNFTYMDVLNLNQHLLELEHCLTASLADGSKS